MANPDLINLEVNLASTGSMVNSRVITATPRRRLSSTVVDSNTRAATANRNTGEPRNNSIPEVMALRLGSAVRADRVDRAGRTTAVVLPEATDNKQVMAVQHKVVTTAVRATTTTTSTTKYELQYATNHSFLT